MTTRKRNAADPIAERGSPTSTTHRGPAIESGESATARSGPGTEQHKSPDLYAEEKKRRGPRDEGITPPTVGHGIVHDRGRWGPE